jgi:single-strand DNA-binding protein
MANLNKVILIGRLTRDPEVRVFNNGGKVAKIGFAVSNRKKNTTTGNWEDEPMFIDVEVFNRGETGKLADLIENYCKKGSQICLEGKLHLDNWDDKTTGQKRTKHKIIAEVIQLLDGRPQDGSEGGGGGGYQRSTNAGGGNRNTGGGNYSGGGFSGGSNKYDEPGDAPAGNSGGDDEIPF